MQKRKNNNTGEMTYMQEQEIFERAERLDTAVLDEAILRFGTPTYVFDVGQIRKTVRSIKSKIGENRNLCYAMKANPFLVHIMAKEVERIEVCSMGEFRICKEKEIAPEKLLISGVMKDRDDLWEILDTYGGKCHYTIESLNQYAVITEWARREGQEVPVYLRLTSGNQFGMDEETLTNVVELEQDKNLLAICGIHYFSGTQKKMKKIREELHYLDTFLAALKEKTGYEAAELEYGPGLAVPYFARQEDERDKTLMEISDQLEEMHWKGNVTLEMGRAFVADCGYYITTVKDTKRSKDHNYCIVDGGMHQMNYDGQIRGMYQPHVTIRPQGSRGIYQDWTICGELCTGNDVLIQNIKIDDLRVGSVIIFEHTGAYAVTEGMALFLSHVLPAVVLYDPVNGFEQLRARRETYDLNM